MNREIGSYAALLSKYLNGEMAVVDFQRAYLEKFKKEVARFDESTFDLLDTLFGDVDAYTSDQELLEENPSYYLDEEALRLRVVYTMTALQRKLSGSTL